METPKPSNVKAYTGVPAGPVAVVKFSSVTLPSNTSFAFVILTYTPFTESVSKYPLIATLLSKKSPMPTHVALSFAPFTGASFTVVNSLNSSVEYFC